MKITHHGNLLDPRRRCCHPLRVRKTKNIRRATETEGSAQSCPARVEQAPVYPKVGFSGFRGRGQCEDHGDRLTFFFPVGNFCIRLMYKLTVCMKTCSPPACRGQTFFFNPVAHILLLSPHNLNVEVDVSINFEYFLIKKRLKTSTTCTYNMHPHILCTVSLPCSLDIQWGCHKPRNDVKSCVFPLKLDSLEYKVVLEKNK